MVAIHWLTALRLSLELVPRALDNQDDWFHFTRTQHLITRRRRLRRRPSPVSQWVRARMHDARCGGDRDWWMVKMCRKWKISMTSFIINAFYAWHFVRRPLPQLSFSRSLLLFSADYLLYLFSSVFSVFSLSFENFIKSAAAFQICCVRRHFSLLILSLSLLRSILFFANSPHYGMVNYTKLQCRRFGHSKISYWFHCARIGIQCEQRLINSHHNNANQPQNGIYAKSWCVCAPLFSGRGLWH